MFQKLVKKKDSLYVSEALVTLKVGNAVSGAGNFFGSQQVCVDGLLKNKSKIKWRNYTAV